MPWDETNCMNERVRFIAAALKLGSRSVPCANGLVGRTLRFGWGRRSGRALSCTVVASSRCRGRRGGKDFEGPEETPALGTAQVACHPRAALSVASAAGGEHDRRGSA